MSSRLFTEDLNKSLLPRDGTSIELFNTVEESSLNVALTFKNLTYTINKGPKQKVILQGISGYARGGEMLAILGPSGGGKSTLLDILARRLKSGAVGGEILLNGSEINHCAFRRISAYVQQEDLLRSYLTVKESIYFAAQLRTPPTTRNSDLCERVQRVMALLGIDSVQNSKIGSDMLRGISGGEKKRCCIAAELVALPSLLFLDEPTTGLDTFTALHLMLVLKDIAQTGVAVVFSIHQPRSGIFDFFDKLLLLNGEGEQAYFGPAKGAIPFLSSIGIQPNTQENPADFLLDVLAVPQEDFVLSNSALKHHDLFPEYSIKAVTRAFRTKLLGQVWFEIDDIKDACKASGGFHREGAVEAPRYFRSLGKQIAVVATRAVINKIRDPIATVVTITVAIFFGLLIGSVYFHLGLSQSSIRNRMGMLFFVVMNTAFSNLGSLSLLMVERNIFVREHQSGMYSAVAYLVGKVVQDVPISLVTNFVFNVIVYFMTGMQLKADKFFFFYLICTLVMLNSYAVCLFVSNLSKNLQIANIIAPLIFVLYLLPSGGILMDVNSLPIIWRWIKYISFVRYGFASLVINEFDGLTFICPSNQTMCIHDGKKYAEMQGFYSEDLGFYVAVCGISVGVYVFLAYIALVFLQTKEGK